MVALFILQKKINDNKSKKLNIRYAQKVISITYTIYRVSYAKCIVGISVFNGLLSCSAPIAVIFILINLESSTNTHQQNRKIISKQDIISAQYYIHNTQQHITNNMSLKKIAAYKIQASPNSKPFNLIISQGSVLDFNYTSNQSKSAIVNAANEGCLGGGGVDGAISNAGGEELYNDRFNLPQVTPGVRCLTGNAVITGPPSQSQSNVYGKLHVPYVIHAVGPNYLNYNEDNEIEMNNGDTLLKSAYVSTLNCGKVHQLHSIAFCLLSAGIFRGSRSLQHVLAIGMKAICQYEGYDELKDVYVCGFTKKELNTLVAIANELGLNEVVDDEEADNVNTENGNNGGNGSADKNDDTMQPKESSDDQQDNGKEEQKEQPPQQNKEEEEKDDTREEWEIQRDDFKSAGDNHFRSKSYALAISSYQDALQLDPTNHVILSNKSAAHLANGEKSKALHDARKCVEHNASWAKGHTRLAAAMASLGRYNEAASVYSKVINELDPNNAVAKKGLEDCRLRQQKAREEKEKEASRLQMELDRQKAEKEEEEKRMKEEAAGKQEGGNDEEDDLLDDFFSEVEKVTDKKPKPVKTDEAKSESAGARIKTQINDLGTSSSQIDRLLQVNYEWKNLNPFNVLDLPHTIDDESTISARYRALSLLVHPDKCPDDPVRAKAAFEQVRKAMTQMNDEDKRRHVQALVEEGMKQGKRDWDATKSKGNAFTTTDAGKEDKEGLAQAQKKAVMKIFAEIEQKRRNIERRKHEFEQRERAQEDEEKAKEKNEREHDKKWREGDRVEKRIGNWRDFSGNGGGGGKKGRLV